MKVSIAERRINGLSIVFQYRNISFYPTTKFVSQNYSDSTYGCERAVPSNDDAEQPRRVNKHFPIFQQAYPYRYQIPRGLLQRYVRRTFLYWDSYTSGIEPIQVALSHYFNAFSSRRLGPFSSSLGYAPQQLSL